jgi:hypothetical protein
MFKNKAEKIKNQLMDDWGKDDVYGPWTDLSKFAIGEEPKFKSYWLVTRNDGTQTDIELPK